MLNHRFRFYLRTWKLPGKRFPFQTPASDFDTAPPTGSVWHLLSHLPQSPTRRSRLLFINILPDPTMWDRPWAPKYVQWTRNMIRDSRIDRLKPTPDAGTLPFCTQTPTYTPNTAPRPLLALTSLCCVGTFDLWS